MASRPEIMGYEARYIPGFFGVPCSGSCRCLRISDLRKLCKRLWRSFVFFIVLLNFLLVFGACPTPGRFTGYKAIMWTGCFWSLCHVVSCAWWQAMRSAMWEERCLTIASTNLFLSWFVISHLRGKSVDSCSFSFPKAHQNYFPSSFDMFWQILWRDDLNISLQSPTEVAFCVWG